MRRRTLFHLILLIGLAYGAFRLAAGKRGPLFETGLIGIDTASVTALSIIPEGDSSQEILLKKEGKTWIASQGPRSVKASPLALTPLLSRLALIRSHHIVTKDLVQWVRYKVDPANGTRVRVFRNGDQLEDFLIGSFEYTADSTGYTHIRLWEDGEVYAVEGDLTVVFNPGFDAFRSNTLLEIDPGKITEISWMRPESDSAILIQASPHLDSFLRDIRFLAGISFADAFDPVRNAQNLEGSITFYTTQWEPPLEVAYYRDTLQDPHFIFSSSWNPDNYFSSDSSGLFGRLVLPLYSFLEPMPIDSATH